MDKEYVLSLWNVLNSCPPIIITDRDTIKKFRTAHDHYAKTWSKLSSDDQGWISMTILNRVYE